MADDSFVSGGGEEFGERAKARPKRNRQQPLPGGGEGTGTMPWVIKPRAFVTTSIEKRYEDKRSAATGDILKAKPLDPDAVIICADACGRKVELHVPGWEEANLRDKRRFALGDIVTLKTGLSGSTLTNKPLLGDRPSYTQAFNESWTIAIYVAHIAHNGVIPKGNTKPCIPQRTVKGRVVNHDNKPGSITVGMLQMYVVEVFEPSGLVGLRLLVGPDMLIGNDGLDGYGLHP